MLGPKLLQSTSFLSATQDKEYILKTVPKGQQDVPLVPGSAVSPGEKNIL